MYILRGYYNRRRSNFVKFWLKRAQSNANFIIIIACKKGNEVDERYPGNHFESFLTEREKVSNWVEIKRNVILMCSLTISFSSVSSFSFTRTFVNSLKVLIIFKHDFLFKKVSCVSYSEIHVEKLAHFFHLFLHIH